MQKGSAQIFPIALAVSVLFIGLFYFYQTINKDDLQISPQGNSPVETINTHTDKNLGFELSYPSKMAVQIDTEEEFNKRGNGDFRKNFKFYVTYPPADFLGAVVLLDENNSYEMSPLTIWIFDNPDDLTINRWYKDYWYYPFVWGDYTARRNTVAPVNEATVSGQIAKFGVVPYQPGEPKFIYISNNGKMYLFRIIGESGDKILEGFKFLK